MKPCRCSAGQLLFVALVGTTALLARLADGYAWCQEYWNWDGKRHSSADGKRWPANDGVVITYINGIFHSVPEWESITHQLQTIFGHEVRSFYNPSSGWWITDASKAGYHLLRKPANDTIAQALGEHLAQAVEDVGRGRVLHIAHSGGALITYLAAQHHLTKRQRDKIDVLTFGGARSITRKYFSGRVVNYYARNDPLVKLDRRAAELMKLTSNTKFEEVNEKHNTTFVFLEGRARQFVLDHSLEGPTYQGALRKEARAFRRAHFGPLSPLSWDYEYSMLRLARKKVAQLSGLHDFFSTEGFGLRSLRKSVARLTGLHGFFSGKPPGSTGVAVSVVGSGDDRGSAASTTEDGGGVSSGGVRWWWPWGRRTTSSSSSSSSTTAASKDGGGSSASAAVAEDGPGGDDRFFLGFRWSRKGKRKQQQGEEQEEDANFPPLSVTGQPANESLGSTSSTTTTPTTTTPSQPRKNSRWAQVRNAWGFGRSQEEPAVTSDGAALSGLAAVERDDDSSGDDTSTAAVNGQVISSPAAESNNRPWLSLGWTPWAGRAKQPQDGGGSDDSPASSAGGDGGAGEGESESEGGGESGEAQPGMASVVSQEVADGGEGSTAEGEGKGDGNGNGIGIGDVDGDGADRAAVVAGSAAPAPAPAEDEAVSPSRDEMSHLRRWWPTRGSSSSSSGSVTQGATDNVDVDDVRQDREEEEEGEIEEAEAGGARLDDGDKEPGGGEIGTGGATAAATAAAAAAAAGGGSKVESSPAKKPAEQESKEGTVITEEEQTQSPSLLRRWWPASKQPTSPVPVEDDDGGDEEREGKKQDVLDAKGLNATQAVQVDGKGSNVPELSATGAGDGNTSNEGLENGGVGDLPELPAVQLPRLSSTQKQQRQQQEQQQQQQEEEEEEEQEEEEDDYEEEDGSKDAARTGAACEMPTSSAPTTSFAQRFWEVFTNKPVEAPPGRESIAESNPVSGDDDDDGGDDGVAEVARDAEEGASAEVAAAAELGGTEDRQESEPLVEEGVEAEESLRPIDEDVLPLPLTADTVVETEEDTSDGSEKHDEGGGDGDGAGRENGSARGGDGDGESDEEGGQEGDRGGEDGAGIREDDSETEGARGEGDPEAAEGGGGGREANDKKEGGKARRGGNAEGKGKVTNELLDHGGEGSGEGHDALETASLSVPTTDPEVAMTREERLLRIAARDDSLR